MGRRGKVSNKSNFKNRRRSDDKVSDDSDEDYVVSDEENEESDGDLEDYCSSLDGYLLEEGFANFVEDEEEEEEEEKVEERRVKKVGRPKAKKRVSSGKRILGTKTSKKRKRVSYYEEDDEDYNVSEKEEEEEEEEEDEEEEEEEEVEVEVEEEEEDDDDEEFTLDEDDALDEEEESAVSKKRTNVKIGRKSTRKKSSVRGRKKRRKSSVSKKSQRKRGRRKCGFGRKERCNNDEDGDFLVTEPVVTEKSKKNSGQKKRRYVVSSDSDFVSSGSSDYEYTISEEEREQVREAGKLCTNLRTNLRSSSASKRTRETGALLPRKKPSGRKGKEKVEEVKSEVVKQVCGICLSEEDKRRLRGTLDCCSHYFCFTCIMEWAKVESRCPLCKQRFKTISKPARSTTGVDLRDVVIQVPERDQVYQPTEEELRSFLDPYENVICTECHQGGDDGLMLLCDLCDSSAHTYCVGLGREVPEGNWYCDGCRPVALGSTSSQAPNHSLDQRTPSNNLYSRTSPVVNLGDGLDPISVPSPRAPFGLGLGNLSSPRVPIRDVLSASPVHGVGAPTLSGRRWIHRHIQNILSIGRTLAGRNDGITTANSGNDFLNSLAQSREIAVQPASTQETGMLQNTFFVERLPDNPSSSLQDRNLFHSRSDHLSSQAGEELAARTIDRSVNLTLWPEHPRISSITSREQLHQSSSRSPFMPREEGDFSTAKEQLQVTVETHLKNLSRDVELGKGTITDIVRSSVHTILAACGLEHRRNEVHVVPPPLLCSHVEMTPIRQRSLMKGCCSSCFDSFVKDVVKRIMDTRLPQWLSLGL